MSSLTLSYRLGVASRAIAAIGGGYVLTILAVQVLALTLPMERASATLSATMVSFAIYAAAVLWAFGTPSARQAWIGIAAPAVVLALLLWLRPVLGIL